MLKKTIKYTDYNNVAREEDFYFNLTKAELMEMELTQEGGLAEMIQNIVKANDVPAIVEVFKKLILKAYGEKTADGKRIRKIDDNGVPLSRGFSETEAYSQLFMELSLDSQKAADFINAVVPADMAQEAQKQQKKGLPQDHKQKQN